MPAGLKALKKSVYKPSHAFHCLSDLIDLYFEKLQQKYEIHKRHGSTKCQIVVFIMAAFADV